MNKEDFYFPQAIDWMWNRNGFINLGKFELDGKKYDMGVYIEPVHPNYVSHAIVYNNEDGKYISGHIESAPQLEVCKENIIRFKQYIKSRKEK